MFNETLDIKIPDGKVTFHQGFFNLEESHRLMQSLIKTIEWTQDEVVVYGKRHKIPRLNAWYGDEGKTMTYSGLTLNPKPWTKELFEIISSFIIIVLYFMWTNGSNHHHVFLGSGENHIQTLLSSPSIYRTKIH